MARKYSKKGYKGKKRYKSTGPTQEERKQAAKSQTELALARIADLTEEAAASKEFKQWLSVQGKFHRYSFRNSMLIMLQMPEAQNVASIKTWNAVGRRVKAGEKAKIYVWRPGFKKVENQETGEQESAISGFFLSPVWDISQTDGDDLPDLDYRVEGEDTGSLVPSLEGMIKERGISLDYVADLGGAYGCSMGGKIKVLETCEGLSRARTLVHELAHEEMHKGAQGEHSRSVKEIEAESVTCVVLTALGVEQAEKSAFYLACWGGDREKIRTSMDRIQKVAKRFLEEIQG